MFDSIPKINIGDITMGRDAYIINSAGLAQKISDHSILGIPEWLFIRATSGLTDSGDNEGDSQDILDGINEWYRLNK